MSERVTALGRAGLLLASAALIAKLFAAGQMMKYIAPALDPLIALTGLVFGAMGAMEVRRALRCRSRRHSAGCYSVPRALEHDHGVEGTLERGVTYGVVLLPLVLGMAVAPQALGTSALGGERVTRLLLTFAPGSPATPRPSAPDEPLNDIGPLLAYLRRVGEGSVGQPVRVTGMVMRSDALEAGEFALLRYAMVHCVADARPVVLLVVTPASPDVQPDQWIEIEGELASRERDGDHLVTVLARRIKSVEEPRNPYLFVAY
jgi:putative membrane protein